MIHVLTDSLLEDHLRCHSKSYLRFQGRLGQATAYSNLCARLDAFHRANAFQWLAAQSTTAGVRWFSGSRLEDLATGHAVILDAVGGAEGLETHFHGLQRVLGDSRLGPHHYQPIRVYRPLQPSSAVRLLLAFDALVLGYLQGLSPEDGVLICGPTFRRIRVHLRTYLESLATVLTRLRLQVASVNEPPLALNRHCGSCEFKQLCQAKAEEAGNLTLLRGMTSKEMTRHNSKGIFTVKQLSYTFRSRRPAKRQTQQFPHSFALQALALRENKVHVHGDPTLTLSPTQVYLDIEGLPDRGFYYLIGALVVTGQSQEYHCFWANDENDQAAIFARLAELLTATPDGRVFHYGNYDVNAVRRMLSRVPESSQEALRAMLTNSTNILSIVSSHVYFPTNSNSLKEVASFLGFRWSSVEASGLESIVWREQWEHARDEVLKVKLLQYNRDDCLALRAVTEFMAAIRRREVGGGPEHSRLDKIVYTGELPSTSARKHRFGKSEFCLPDLEFVNRCAYFDYQRDRIYIRAKKRPAAGKSGPTPRGPRRARVNKRIEVRCKRCPHCSSRRLSEGRVLSTRTIDMKFLASGGVKKWVTAYSSQQYHCHKCGNTFRPPEYPQTANLYGTSLVNWTIYQNVALGQNMLKVERCLREVFKLNIPQPTLHRFKALVARRYEPTKEAILADLLRGPSLSIDETEARLCKEKAYVWVFAGVSGAYYECRDSRNGQFLTERLKGFSGVLVSDFFSAYDSIDCPQQKCLIHLIRDMNEDMKANPFDMELKGIVKAFASVTRPIIETVDRHGLTKSRLQKHKIAAMAFVEKVVGNRLSSEAATKYQNRIEKYGHRLFTFLDYDGVPWNNNNAEHAIKAFARYRRFADGRFTKKSVRDYLAILSVFQTCEYQGKEVLKFLLSGETRFAFPNTPGPPWDRMRKDALSIR
jgi:predicted RecB family nuclease